MLTKTVCLVGLSAVSAVNAVQYGYNHVPVRPDSELVAANFEDVDIELLSPAFLTPDDRQAGFGNGTQGPTSHEDMGMFPNPKSQLKSYSSKQRHTWRKSLPGTIT